ncbi:unnamed protein product [Rotaria magnacalcarata]
MFVDDRFLRTILLLIRRDQNLFLLNFSYFKYLLRIYYAITFISNQLIQIITSLSAVNSLFMNSHHLTLANILRRTVSGKKKSTFHALVDTYHLMRCPS